MSADSIANSQPVKRKKSGGGRAFHSRLEPFVDFIREQRQRRKTWQEIAAALSGEKNCAITAQGVHQFYRRHLRQQAKGHWEESAIDSRPARPDIAASRPQPRPAPLPTSPAFKRPNLSTSDTEDFT